RVTITSSPRQGPSATIDLPCALASRGMTAVPHLAARALRDENQLAGILDSLSEAGVGEPFVIAGVPAQPAGDFVGSLDLLTASTEHAQPVVIGVGWHPEGRPVPDQGAALPELGEKASHAAYIVTLLCFGAAPLLACIIS